jgi:hypothetical protein
MIHFALGVPHGWGWLIAAVSASLLAAQRQKGTSWVGATLCVWGIANGTHLTLWSANLAYTQRDASLWVAENLPPNSVLIGDCAPALCLNNRFRVVPLIPNLCNDKQPLERFAGSSQVIAILDGHWKERWWRDHYPNQVKEARRTHLFSPLVSHPVGLYRVQK